MIGQAKDFTDSSVKRKIRINRRIYYMLLMVSLIWRCCSSLYSRFLFPNCKVKQANLVLITSQIKAFSIRGCYRQLKWGLRLGYFQFMPLHKENILYCSPSLFEIIFKQEKFLLTRSMSFWFNSKKIREWKGKRTGENLARIVCVPSSVNCLYCRVLRISLLPLPVCLHEQIK